MRPLLSILPLLAGLAVPAQAATFYKWVDPQGETHYSQIPPGPGQGEKIHTSGEPSGGAARPWREQIRALDERRRQQQLDAKLKQTQATLLQAREENCTASRNNLKLLIDNPNRRLRQPDGSIVRYTEEQRQERITQTRKDIQEYCD